MKILAKNLFDCLDGLRNLPQNSVFRVVLEGEFFSLYRIKLKTFGADEIIQHYKISTPDILALDQVRTSELQNQSILSRGVVGGLLFDPIGMLLGGVSTTRKQKIKTTLAISHLPSSRNESKTVILADATAWRGNNTVPIVKLKNELARQPRSERVVRYLGQTVNEDGSITLQPPMSPNNRQEVLRMLDEKDLQSIQATTDASIRASENRVIAYFDTGVMPRFDPLAEGSQGMQTKLTPMTRIEAIGDDVALLKQVIRSMSRELAGLKKAQ